MKKIITIILALTGFATASLAKDYDFVVAQDGSGDFFTVQEAVDAAPDYCKQAATEIFIKPGIYKEKLVIAPNKEKIHLIGSTEGEVKITYDDYALKNGSTGFSMGTSATPTVFVHASDFLAENITFENSSGEGKDIGQACAIMVNGDRVAFIGCRFIANQDTIYTFGKGQRQYFRNCHIEGTTDFIFGASTAYFEDCTILSKKDSYVTAASTPEEEPYGYVFRNCRLIAADGVSDVYLGRPWRPFARTVFIDCEMGAHILKEGWHNWNKKYAEKTVLYAEYASTGDGASKDRVKWSRQLKEKELPMYEKIKVLDTDCEIDKNGKNIKTLWFFADYVFGKQ